MHRSLRALVTAALALPVLASAARAAQGPPPEVREAVGAVVAFLDAAPEGDPLAFARDRLTAEYRASFTDDEALRQHLVSIREAARGRTGDVAVEAVPDGLRLILGDGVTLALALAPGTANLTRLELVAAVEGGDRGTTGPENHMRALEGLANSGPEARRAFAEERLDPDLRARLGADGVEELLDAIRRAVGSATVFTVDFADDYRLGLRGGIDVDVVFTVSDEPPFLIDDLRLEAPAADGGTGAPPLTWETLDDRLQALASAGFAGSVVAVRDGETVLARGYGDADRAAGRSNDPTTIFGIGSIPIDFTRTAVHLLVQQGRLSLDDTLADLFPDVPSDKRDITVAQLLAGTSGLPNFHHTPSDADRDLTWIDRAEAERRILGMELLFEPGTSRAASHSAFGLLAAAVERRSGQSYPDFLREHVFEPAGMHRTGFYGDDGGHPREAFARGYGEQRVGPLNIPPEWGPTSWLVMGSGGMWSTPDDMARYFEAVRSGRILRGDALEAYLDRGPALGASDRGFHFVHAWGGADTSIYLAANAGTRTPEFQGFVRRLLELVGARPIA